MAIPNIIADFSTILALKVAAGATTATLVSATDSNGVALPTGTYGFTIDRKNSSKEYITCTLTSTALTAISTVAVGTGVATSGFAKAHRRSAEVIISDFVVIKRLQDVFETGYDAATTPTTAYQLATKKYVDDIALGGSTTVDKITIVATCGEDVVAGNLLYLKVSDSKWWKTDADTIATIENVGLGIAQGTGSANGLITGGVLIRGVDTNQTVLTANSIYYAGNTAGAISATTGTNTRVIGVATSTTKLYFDSEFYRTFGYYAVDAVGTDAYAITVSAAVTAYVAGQVFNFKAGIGNTEACTLNVNGLGVKNIYKSVSINLQTGDIKTGQIVSVTYDGTNFQMISSNRRRYYGTTISTSTNSIAPLNTAHSLGFIPTIGAVSIICIGNASIAFRGIGGGASGRLNDGTSPGAGALIIGTTTGNYHVITVTADATNIIVSKTTTGTPGDISLQITVDYYL